MAAVVDPPIISVKDEKENATAEIDINEDDEEKVVEDVECKAVEGKKKKKKKKKKKGE